MNIKELIFSIPALDLAEAYAAKYDDLSPEKKGRVVDQVAAFIGTLKDRKPKDTGHLILGISFVDDDEDEGRHEFLDACLFKKDDLAAQFDWDSPMAKVAPWMVSPTTRLRSWPIPVSSLTATPLSTAPGMRSWATRWTPTTC